MLFKKQAGTLRIAQGGVVKELLKEGLLLLRSELGRSTLAWPRAEVTLLALQLKIAPDSAGVDPIAHGYVFDLLTFVNSSGDALP